MKIRIIIGALVLLVSGQVNAAIIDYDESLDGDISGNPNFHLDAVGANTWRGSVSFSGLGHDFDDFSITLATPLQITAYSVVLSNPVVEDVSAEAIIRWILSESDPTTLQQDNFDVFTSAQTMEVGPVITPFSAAVLNLSQSASCRGCPSSSYLFGADYLVTVVTGAIPAVPVPAAIWLFGTGLLGLIGFSKRRKSQ